MKRTISFNKQHSLSRKSAPFFNAHHLACTQPKPALSKKRLVTKSSTNDVQSNADRVIRNDPRSNRPQVWRLERLNRFAGPKPQYAGYKKVFFYSGYILLAVDALYVPRVKEFCVKRTYRFCVDTPCFSEVPRFSNLKPARNALEERLRKTLKEHSLWG